MKNKGFTLVELLVVIVILGIVTGISIPILRGLQEKNTTKKYEVYMSSLVSATKLYIDSYGDDLFGDNPVDCAIVTYINLDDKNLFKDIQLDEDVSCKSEKTYVKVKKVNDAYKYYPSIGCGTVGNDGTVSININMSKDPDPEETCL